MGIINVTPDSFSGDGLLLSPDYVAYALKQAEEMVAEGADMLDIGGESTRPGYSPVPPEEEIRRVVPVISAIKNKLKTIPLAVDTIKADVAERALASGASIINDISALTGDPRMGEVVRQHNASVILMHNEAMESAFSHHDIVGGQYNAPSYEDVVSDVIRALEVRIEFALDSGIPKENIILDPGIGFGKTPDQNLALIARLHQIKEMGFPVLMALSRKSFIGHVLDTPVDERLEGTAAALAISIFQGADIVRVHDVKFMARVARMAAALRDAARSDH